VKDLQKAVNWLQKAADNDHDGAKKKLRKRIKWQWLLC
jgi:TPR repeat protein